MVVPGSASSTASWIDSPGFTMTTPWAAAGAAAPTANPAATAIVLMSLSALRFMWDGPPDPLLGSSRDTVYPFARAGVGPGRQQDAEHQHQDRGADCCGPTDRREGDHSEQDHHIPEPLGQRPGADHGKPGGPEEHGTPSTRGTKSLS